MTDVFEEWMAYLQQDPYLFHMSKDAVVVDILLKLGSEGGKSAHQISEEMSLPYDRVKKKMEDLLKHGILEKMQAGPRWIYFLSFRGKEFVDKYKKVHG